MNSIKPPRKIVHIIGRLIPGGVEIRTLELIKATANGEVKHYIYVASGLSGSLDDLYRDAGAEIIYENIKSRLFGIKFYKFLKSESIDVVHSNIMHSSGLILAIARVAGISHRIAHFQSDGPKLSALSRLQLVKRRFFTFLIDRFATKIIGLTPASLEAAWKSSWSDDPRCLVVTNGVQIKDFQAFFYA